MLDRTIPFCHVIMRCDRILPMEIHLPDGYRMRSYQPGDEEAWAALEAAAGDFADAAAARDYFVRTYLSDPVKARERVFFAAAPDGSAVGSVIAWENERHGLTVPALHWLAVDEKHQRRGLGRALCQHAMRFLRRLDNSKPTYLHTQPWSWKAMLLYVSLGFRLQPQDTFATYPNEYEKAMAVLRGILSQEQLDLLVAASDPAVDTDAVRRVKFDGNGLVPAIAQDASTGEVLMLAYMNRESLQLTLDTGYATYYSRSRRELWRKGATSGHLQRVIRLHCDCDGDAILMQVDQTGPACHTGQRSCFHNPVLMGDMPPSPAILEKVYATVADRDAHPREGSYTNYLLQKGVDKIAKKVGEEASETIIAAVRGNAAELTGEAADLLYHLTVLLYSQGVTMKDVWQKLEERH
ncbi:MAG: bifunctional phosphoribosyl-AMP cyclohydrolase/phosphoribosyl-ATP diphosphatase HisIE [Clostridia bacterium]|nr:bifunctional phosphoribosyl-AMP cyclohydrolase/phosphoribosyl-ATP diphosphatase HisIE [Clostridia bacterium]